MSANTYVADVMIRHQMLLLRTIGSDTKKAKKYIDSLSKETKKVLGSGKGEVKASKLVELSKSLFLIKNSIANNTGESVTGSLQEFTVNEVDFLETLLNDATVDNANIVFTSPEMVLSTISENPMVLTSTTGVKKVLTINEMISTLEVKPINDIIRVVQFGMTQGLSTRVIVNGVASKSKVSKRDIETVIRTVRNHIANEARTVVAKANKNILSGEKYLATLDSSTTILCAGLDGNIYPIGVGPHPPLHYNCRSLRIPVIDSKYGLDGLVGDRPYSKYTDDGTYVAGPVSADTKYSAWLRTQSNKFQDEFLGPERGDLFRSGKIPLDKFVDHNFKLIKIKDLKKLEKGFY